MSRYPALRTVGVSEAAKVRYPDSAVKNLWKLDSPAVAAEASLSE